MKKVARLVEFSLRTRVVVDENATDDDIIKASYKGIQAKISNQELGDNLVEAELDEECPFGTFDDDNPTIDRVILNSNTKEYLIVGKGMRTEKISFDEFEEWNSIDSRDGNTMFDIQMDNYLGETKYDFQYIELEWYDDNWHQTGDNFISVDVELTELPINQEFIKLFQNNL